MDAEVLAARITKTKIGSNINSTTLAAFEQGQIGHDSKRVVRKTWKMGIVEGFTFSRIQMPLEYFFGDQMGIKMGDDFNIIQSSSTLQLDLLKFLVTTIYHKGTAGWKYWNWEVGNISTGKSLRATQIQEPFTQSAQLYPNA